MTCVARSIANGLLNVEISRQSSDAMAVLDAVTVQVAHIVGVSSGAIIVLDIAYRYPGQVKDLIAFEPPLVKIHPRCRQLQKLVANVYAAAINWGRGLAGLRTAIGAELPIKPLIKAAAKYKAYRAQATVPYTAQSTADEYLDLVSLINYKPQIEHLKNSAIHLYTGAGDESIRKKRFYAETAKLLATEPNCDTVQFPGHHFCFFHDAEACAKVITETLLAHP